MRHHPKSCAPIGPWPHAAKLPRPEMIAFVHPAQHGQAAEVSCAEHCGMNHLTPNSRAVFWRLSRVALVRHSPSGTPRHSAVSAGQCACSVRTPRSQSGLGRAAHLCLVVTAEAEMRGGAGCPLPFGGDIGGRGGERRSMVRRRCKSARRPE